MRSAPFNSLLTGSLSSRLVWERSHRCPCVGADGAADRHCAICRGRGRYYETPSEPFRAGLVGLSAKALENQLNKLGPGLAGDSTLSLPSTAPCYGRLMPGDRVLALDALDTWEWVVIPSVPVRLPSLAAILEARVRSAGAILEVPTPDPGPDGLVKMAVPTTLTFRAPRRYEVLPDAGQARAFGLGLPRKFSLKLVDISVR